MTNEQEIIATADAELRSVKAKIKTGDFIPLGLDWRDRTAASENLRSYSEDIAYWIGAMRRAVRRDDPEAFAEANEHFTESVGDVYQYAASLDSYARMGW